MDDSRIITVEDLWRRYGGAGRRGFNAMRGVSFAVRRGELFALLGTNGAGKTSTLEVLEGLAPPMSGVVRVLGCDPDRARRLVRRRIGIMLQEGGSRPISPSASPPGGGDPATGVRRGLGRDRSAVDHRHLAVLILLAMSGVRANAVTQIALFQARAEVSS